MDDKELVGKWYKNELTEKFKSYVRSLSDKDLKNTLISYIHNLSNKEFAQFCSGMFEKDITYLGTNIYIIKNKRE